MSYNKKVWKSGDRITKEALNNMENGIEAAHQNSGGTGSVAIVDNLNSDSSTSALSAKQGKELNNKMPAKSIVEGGKIYLAKEDGTKLDSGTELPAGGSTIEVVNNLESDSTTAALSAAQGKALNTQYKDIAKQISASNVAIKDIFANNELPRIYMTSDKLGTLSSKNDGEANCECEIKINNKTIKGYATGKVQGTTSATFPGKNFTFKFFKDVLHTTKLKIDVGWGEQSKYCFKKNWVDTTHTRNISGARIAYDMVESRPSSDFKTNLQTAPRNGVVDGFPCKLYINGEFWGLYTWNIPKDDWMFNMDSDNPNHMVLCAEQNNNGNTINDNVLRCEFRKEWDGSDGSSWSIEVGTLSDALKNSFNRCVNFTINSSDQEFHDNISDYFDLYSLLDYILFSRFVCHLDGLAKNMLMVTYDGIHWGAILYDMDSIYGAWYDGSRFVATDYKCPEQYQETNSLLWQRIETCFVDELKARYNELRQGALSLGNIITHVEEIYDLIPDRVFNDDKAKWTAMPSLNTNTITRFRNYMRDRAVYVDNYINNLVEPKPCTDITLNNSTLSFTSTDTQTLTATVTPSDTTDIITWSVSPSGICTIDNGVVTPIKNGECVITATCGSHSATCNVTVSLPAAACTSIALNKTALQLGTIQGTQPDTETNLIEGLTWKDGQLKDSTGEVITGTDKYITDIKIPATGLYTLSVSVNYTYLKMFVYDNYGQLLRSYLGKNNNNPISVYIYEPNCYISVSVFPNSLDFDANNVTLKYVHNLASTPNKDVDIQASVIATPSLLGTSGDYSIIELYADTTYDDVAAIKLGSTIYKLYNYNAKNLLASEGSIAVTRANNGYCTKGAWDNKTFFSIAVPSTWGDTASDITNYIQTNNIAVVINPSEYLNSADKVSTMIINNYQLVPTVEPSNTADTVVWSVSPEGIVAVNNGLVKAVSNGETVVTATCGTKSATCNVSVINLKDPNIISPQEFMIPCDNFVAAGGNVTVNDNTIHFTAANRNNYNSYYLRTKAEGTGKDIADGLNITIEAGKKIHLSFNYEVTKKASESINIGYVINKKNENTGEYKISSVGTGQGELNFTVINNSTLNDIYIYPGNPGEYDFSITFNDIEILDA